MILLDSAQRGTTSPVSLGIFLVVLGILALWGGIRMRNARIPNFVTTYNGRSSGTLALPYTGICLICLGVADSLPVWAKGLIGLILFPTGAIALLGMLFWFPRFLLPTWYRRAIKAGIPRNDRHLMGWFKELSEDGQKELSRLREEHETRTSATD